MNKDDNRKPILNRGEREVADVIKQACKENEAELYIKMRIADVIRIEF